MKPNAAADTSSWIPSVISQDPDRTPASTQQRPRLSRIANGPIPVRDDVTATPLSPARALTPHAHLQAEALRELGLMPPHLICPAIADRERIAGAIATRVLNQVMVGAPAPVELRLIDAWRAEKPDAPVHSHEVFFTIVAWPADSPPPPCAATSLLDEGWYPHDPLSLGEPGLDLQRAPIRLTGGYLVRRQRPR